jgi:hypothetical protein
VYLAIAVRNVGSGMAVLHGWSLLPDTAISEPHADIDSFHRLTRDLYIAPGDLGFWQGALRDPSAADFPTAHEMVVERRAIFIDVLYGDPEGGQRAITRYRLMPYTERWLASVGRHWNVDRPQWR